MKIVHCKVHDLSLVIEALTSVKAEEDPVTADRIALKSFLDIGSNIFLAAVENDRAVGYAIAYRLNRIDGAGDMLCLYEIGVLRAYRKQGTGSALINELKAYCKTSGICKMWVPTEKSNTAACALYAKTGGKASENADQITYTYRFEKER